MTKTTISRYSPEAELYAFQNPLYAFNQANFPTLTELADAFSKETVITLIGAHLTNYSLLNRVSLPSGGQDKNLTAFLLRQMNSYIFDAIRNWTVGEMLYFFSNLNQGIYGTEQYLTPQTFLVKVRDFEKTRQEKRSTNAKEVSKKIADERNRLLREAHIQNPEASEEQLNEIISEPLNAFRCKFSRI